MHLNGPLNRMEKQKIALEILKSMIGSGLVKNYNSAAGCQSSLTEEQRREVVERAFNWADTFDAVARERSSAQQGEENMHYFTYMDSTF